MSAVAFFFLHKAKIFYKNSTFSSVISFSKKRNYHQWKWKYLRPCIQNLLFALLQIGHKLEKLVMSQFADITSQNIFWRCCVSLVNFSYWSISYVNIVTGSGVMTICLQGIDQNNLEIGNTSVWVLANILRLGQECL